MEIITLQAYTDQYVSLYEGEIRNLPNDLALRLINKGVAAQHDKDILNSTTTQDNGKVLTVVNGKPAFSAPATPEVNMNYSVIYADSNSVMYKDNNLGNQITTEQFMDLWTNSDFIIINKYEGYDQYEKVNTEIVYSYIIDGSSATVYNAPNSVIGVIGVTGTGSTVQK